MVYRIPGASSRVTQTFDEHVRTTGLGAIDFADARGTTMHFQQVGTVIAVDNNPSGAEGRMVTIRYDDGVTMTQAHASTITAVRGQRGVWGDPAGVSGGSGFGDDFYYGPHIHNQANNAAGQRFDQLPFIQLGTTTAGGGTTPFPDEEEQDMAGQMFLVHRTTEDGHPVLNGMRCLITPDTFRHFGSEQDYNAFARVSHMKSSEATDREFILMISALDIPLSEVRPRSDTWRRPGVSVNPAPIVQAVKDAIAAQGVEVDFTPVQVALERGFAAVNANVDQIPLGFNIIPK